MANANLEVSMQSLHSQIAAQIKAAIPAFELVEFFRENEGEDLPTPACLLEYGEFETAEGQDHGTGQYPARLRFEARILIPNGKGAALEARKASLKLAAFLHLRRWNGIQSDEARVLGGMPDDLSDHKEAFQVWVVEWVQTFFIGANIHKDSGDAPDTVFLGFAPRIGAAHEQDYFEIEGAP